MARQRVLEALIEVTKDGWPASVREVMRAAGLASPSTAHNHLLNLANDGRAEQHPRRPEGGWLPVLWEGA